MQVYVKRSDEAVALYQRAFNAPLVVAYPNDDGTYMHAELDVYGQILAIAETDYTAGGTVENGTQTVVTGNSMQFCLHFGSGCREKIDLAYETLREGGTCVRPLGDGGYSPYHFTLIDRFGVNWCVFE
jgi:PhnB protein